MTTEDIIIHIFCHVDDRMKGEAEIVKHVQAKLYPSELVTIGLLMALKGVSFRAFYRWLKRDYDRLFGGLPDRTRLMRALKAHQDWCDLFLAEPTFFLVGDSYPIELLFPIREGRSKRQIGRKGRDKGRWTIGIRLWWLLDQAGQVVEWYWLPLNQPDKDFNALAEYYAEQSIVLTDLGFRDKDGIPSNLKVCPKGTWNERMIVETSFSMLTLVCHTKKFFHRRADYLWSHLAYLAAMFNVLTTLFHQLFPDDTRRRSIAEFSL
jgi:hypothetical protein